MTRQNALSDARRSVFLGVLAKKYDCRTEVSEVDRVITL